MQHLAQPYMPRYNMCYAKLKISIENFSECKTQNRDLKMDNRYVTRSITALILVTIFFGVCLWIYLPFTKVSRELEKKREEQRIQLLCNTNYQALLEACRGLSKQVESGELESNIYYMTNSTHQPVVSRFSPLILNLNPAYVVLDGNGCVIIAISRFGVRAYSEDYKKPRPDFVYGDKELIPGLWYFDEDYKDNPKYQKKIDNLIQIGKSKQKELNSGTVTNNESVP
jgi:hypothetical protein